MDNARFRGEKTVKRSCLDSRPHLRQILSCELGDSMSGGIIALAVACAGAAAISAFVHYDQKREIRRMRASVFEDAARERFRQSKCTEKTSGAQDSTGATVPTSDTS